MEQILFDLKLSDERSQRELARYRELGPVYTLRRMTRMQRRRQRRIQLVKRILAGLLCAVCAVWCIWVFASWMDTVFHNLDPNPVYQPWNLINFTK